jgi:hypothetical protein
MRNIKLINYIKNAIYNIKYVILDILSFLYKLIFSYINKILVIIIIEILIIIIYKLIYIYYFYYIYMFKKELIHNGPLFKKKYTPFNIDKNLNDF